MGKGILRFINSAFGMGSALAIGSLLPERLGRAIAGVAARGMALRKTSTVYRAVRSNLRLALPNENPRQLEEKTRQVFVNQAAFLFDFYHNLRRPQKVRALVCFSPGFEQVLHDCMRERSATIFVAPHIGPIDLAGYAIALFGLPVQILSYPNLNNAYRWQNLLRKQQGLNITPISPAALTQARELLQRNGTVLTGLDRPNPGCGYAPRFFGHPAEVPVFYVKLALKVHACVRVVVIHKDAFGKYMMECSEAIEMEAGGDAREEILSNAERVIAAGEVFISRYPDQWSMFYPLWPAGTSEEFD